VDSPFALPRSLHSCACGRSPHTTLPVCWNWSTLFDCPQGRFYWQPIVSPLFLALWMAHGVEQHIRPSQIYVSASYILGSRTIMALPTGETESVSWTSRRCLRYSDRNRLRRMVNSQAHMFVPRIPPGCAAREAFSGCRGSCRRNDAMADQRFGAPVVAYEGEQSVLDLVPLSTTPGGVSARLLHLACIRIHVGPNGTS
jgi:hypothetical protein